MSQDKSLDDEPYVSIADIVRGKHTGQEVAIRGWVHRIRSGGSIVFAVVRDGEGIVQCTVKKGAVVDEDFDKAARTLVESSVEITGTIA